MKDNSDSFVTKKKKLFDLPMRLLIIGKTGDAKSTYLGNLLLREEMYRNAPEPILYSANGGVTNFRGGGNSGDDDYPGGNLPQIYAPDRAAYDVNPNFMAGFNPETMYFNPATIAAPASSLEAGGPPVVLDTYTGTKGGYGGDPLVISPEGRQASIDPFSAYTGEAPAGLVPYSTTQPAPYIDITGEDLGLPDGGGEYVFDNIQTLDEQEGGDDFEFNIDDYYKTNRLNIADIRNNPYNYLSARNQGSMYAADGGLMRTGYAEGSEEPVAKKTMPLLDMDGQEMDLREEGGFVPLGRMERADDVPARLSKNEFVFTADAVRNAGEGDVDKGAEVMYNMMKNLESGGEVSEESQGLDGAREMFKTSQRLEEVI